ncbi:PepSY domain-containing protein [Sinorhizobium terangae]|uniref:PepSY domain-containing protein n=1 Tax=Sinorhizobium terangae TaxID=110322 RepID=UPI0024B22941|nr:hypothetical protein [Sinorhizobium terangae]WFU47756.1 hypothetical protein QA637_18230 [Sinorhizobium terangae]
MVNVMRVKRRLFIALLSCCVFPLLAPHPVDFAAHAASGSGSSGSGSSGSGSSGSGSSGSNSGSGSSGSNSGSGGSNSGSGSSNSGSGSSGHGGHGQDDDGEDAGGRRSDQERVRDAVVEGRILPLKDVLRLVDEDKYGAVIGIDLRRYGGSDVYRLTTRDGKGVIRDLRINARTGKFMNILGF